MNAQPVDAQPVVATQSPMVVTVQPNRNYWQTDLCDCCSDCGVCLCGLFCLPCMVCNVSADMDECCCCALTVAMRAVYRTKYNIPGSICEDACIVAFCPLCSLCQIQRDINKRREMGIF